MRIRKLACALLLSFGLTANAANTITTVYQVVEEVTVSEDVDFVISHTEPFVGEGKVNITNTEHAVVIFKGIRPSYVIKNHLQGKVFINGEQAVNGTNCQVKMYAHGSIVMPYAKDFKPLTVYSEQNYEGTAVNDFGLEHSGGFMNTLSEAKLNNKIRSFKLKRGYMVTFATGKSGWGYSRCFIADTEDLEIPELPAVLDGRISSYRVFQWYDAEKKGLASDTRMSANDLLASSWCYTWGVGTNMLPDHECIPHRIHEGWPNPADCGKATFSCHMKTNNEPGNSADDTPNTVAEILNNWQTLMRTGMRLCSESSHDGSWSHLRAFIDSVDARGWRCDILDLHCYWATGFDDMKTYYERYGNRPIWISEFVWGASWNNNGIFATDRSFSQENQQKNLDAMKGIFASLNNSPYVERYAYWNSEADCSKLLRGESELSLTGKYFQTMQSGMAYRKKYEKVPRVVYTAPTGVSGTWVDQEKGAYRISWKDTNFDMLNEMQVQRKKEGESTFTVVGVVKPADQSAKSATINYTDTLTESGVYEYRIVNVTADNDTRISSTIKVGKSHIEGSSVLQFGELIMLNDEAISMNFSENFDTVPAVFMGAVTNNNAKLQPASLITGASKQKFTYQPLPWIGSTSTKFEEQETIPFMAMKQGRYKFDNLDCEIGEAKVYTTTVCEITFAEPFPENVTPIVLTEIRNQLYKSYPMSVKVHDITNVGFKCTIMLEEEAKNTTLPSTVCYMAITPGVGTVDSENDVMIAAGKSDMQLYGSMTRLCYFTYGGDTLRFVDPYIFANLQTTNYEAATMVRRQKATLYVVENDVTYTIGGRFRRVVDPTRETASDGTKLNSTSMRDDLGWVVLYTRAEGTPEPTMIKDIEAESVLAPLRPYVLGNAVYVDGYDEFDIYTIHGVKLASPQMLPPGVYVVKAGNNTAMVVVK